jgi:hypothetical protein
VITSFFNPAGYRRRLLNYRRFRAALQVPLAAVELSFTGSWELEEHDADILIRVTDGDVMWQKERLLNQVITQLPPECEYVAWIDADVLMQDPDWPQQAVHALESMPLVQLFSRARDLEHDGAVPQASVPSVAALVLQGDTRVGSAKHGLAWGAKRSLLDRYGLYDSCVIGSGDNALMRAAYGMSELAIKNLQMSQSQRDHYLQWATGFYEEVQGQVGALPGEIHHLWHGSFDDRRYKLRHGDLALHDFDPVADICIGSDGAWRWASEKPELHTLLGDYFQSRNDDGKPVGVLL